MAAHCRRRSTSIEPPAMPRPPASSAHDRLTGTVATTHPLLLFPVRVETRFTARREAPGTDLLLRVYPDDIHLDSHEPALTETRNVAARSSGHMSPQLRLEPTGRTHQARLATTHRTVRQHPRRLDRQTARSFTGATVTRRDDSWTRAPRAGSSLIAGLPSVIAATGRVSPPGASRSPRPWRSGLTHGAPDPLGGNGLPPVDAGMRWITGVRHG